MAPPPGIDCSDAECSYTTPANIPSYELILKALELHVKTAHTKQVSGQANQKTEKPKRPSISTGLSESEWTFFISKWERYVRQTKVEGQQLLDELWNCMDEDLEKLAFGDNMVATGAQDLLSKIKCLAVTTIHPSLHVVNLHKMTQNHDEPTKAFSARVRAVAVNCELKKPCSNGACSEIVSYIEETCYHVVMAGLVDADMKDRALTQAMLGAISDLPTLVNFATAEESARQSTKTEVSAVRNKPKPLVKKNVIIVGIKFMEKEIKTGRHSALHITRNARNVKGCTIWRQFVDQKHTLTTEVQTQQQFLMKSKRMPK